MKPNEIKAEVHRLHLLESDLIAQIKAIRKEKKTLKEEWFSAQLNQVIKNTDEK